MNNVVVYDSGNDLWKIRSSGKEAAIRHALMRLTESEYEKIVKETRGNPPHGYIRVNGVPYAFGEVAERRGADKKTGAARYSKDYYGVSLAIMLAEIYNRGGDVLAFCSHAPRDIDYADDLIDAAIGRYHVEIGKVELNFKVTGATTFSEPVGGLMNVMLREDGKGYARADINSGDSLVIDIGGFTTDWVSVAEGGVVDFVVNASEQIGIQESVRSFAESFRSNHRSDFKDTSELPPQKLRKAIATGIYHGGGREYPCVDEAREAINKLLNRISIVYQSQAGGAGRWDNIVLTGGGSAMLYTPLVNEVLNHGRVFLADQDHEAVHLANVRGGLKLWRLYEALELI